MSGRAWKIYAATAALLIVGYQFIPAEGWWVSGWQVGVGYLGVAAIVVGARRLPRRDRLPWWCLAVGVGANVTGIPVALYAEEVLGWDDLPTPADPLFLLLYPACAVGLALLIRRREPYRNWMALVDAATITTGFGLLAWVYVIKAATVGQDIGMLGRAVQAAYPIGDLLLLAMMTRLLRGGGRRGAPFWWITGSLGAFLLGDTAWVVIGNIDTLGAVVEQIQWVSRSIDMVFLVAFTLFGVASLHTDAAGMSAPVGPRAVRLGRVQLTLLTGASLIAPAVLAVEVHQGEVMDGAAIVIGCTVLFLLVVTRMAHLLRELERHARQVHELARRDELTGLPNRRAWNDELPRALELARRDGRPVSVALLDLDHFKAYNDANGHPAGDRLLKEASAAWHGELRKIDILARYGGEEFIALLPDITEDGASHVLQRALGATPQGQTFSAGVAAWDGSETSEQLIQRADAALYAAKAAGRNRIMTQTALSSSSAAVGPPAITPPAITPVA